MIECNLIKTEVITLGKKEKKSVVIPTDLILNSIDLKKNNSFNLPFRIPMMVKPKLYYKEVVNDVVRERLGGYLLNDVKTSDNVMLDN
jgi:hypothetical protein